MSIRSIKTNYYSSVLKGIKERIQTAQIKAALSVNRELIQLYWEIGERIVKEQEKQKWGNAFIARLANDLRKELPEVKGFSSSNLWRMRSFYLIYSQRNEILAQPVREFGSVELTQAVAEIPWGHNILLLEKIKDQSQRLWYAQKAIEHGWSRAVLWHQIDTNLYARQSKKNKLTNFSKSLPPFYHLKLRCFVVIDLKMQVFKPEFTGKMNFYLSAVDDLLRDTTDKPSIGIILCKSKNNVLVEYALRDMKKPMGVAGFVLTHAFIKAHPKSKKILVLQKDPDHYEVWVRESPDKGKANEAVIEALSEHLGVPSSKISVSSGLASRNKVIEIIS